MHEDQFGITCTVGELIELLRRVPDQSLPVRTEGCDCLGDAAGLQVDGDGVLIVRRNPDPRYMIDP
jgi:hypothetical protein